MFNQIENKLTEGSFIKFAIYLISFVFLSSAVVSLIALLNYKTTLIVAFWTISSIFLVELVLQKISKKKASK